MSADKSAAPHGAEPPGASRPRDGTPRPPVARHRRLVGDARVFGEHACWSLAVDERGAFDWYLEGELGERMACDGSDAVARDWTGASRVLEMGELESRRTVVWALTGAPGDGPPGGDGRLRIELDRAPDGSPTALRYATQAGVEAWRLEGTRSSAGWTPRRIVKEIGGVAVEEIDVQGCWRDIGERLRLPPWTEPADFVFEAAADAVLQARTGPHGHLLVRARLDGGPESWFILDSGASNSAVTPEAARRADLTEAGCGVIASVMGTARAPIYRAGSLSVGPLTLRDPRLVGLDLAPFGDVFGVPVDGVLGFEVFRRARIRIVFAQPGISVHPSEPALRGLAGGSPGAGVAGRHAATPDGPDPRWSPVSFNMQHPVVAGRIGGSPALLRIDIGMGGEVAAIMHAGALERLGVEASLDDERFPMGAGSARAGRVPAVELAGRRWEPAAIVLPEVDDGVFHDPWVDATIGHGLLRAFDVTFDYPNARIGFEPAA